MLTVAWRLLFDVRYGVFYGLHDEYLVDNDFFISLWRQYT